MNLLQLKYFRQLAKDENFTKAAQALYVSQPALSQMISRLEEEVGTQLFHRYGKKIQLNKNGELFLEYVSRALHEIDTGLAELTLIQSRDTGEISFSSMCNILSFHDIIISFKEKYPDVKLKYNMCNADKSVKSVLNYEIEFAINNRYANDQRLENYLIHSFPVFICLGKGHPLACNNMISVCDLKDSSFICNDFTTDRYETERICQSFGFMPDIAIECNDPHLISTILGIQPYVMFFKPPALLHRQELLSPPQDSILRLRENIESPLVVTRRKKHHFSPIKEEFYDFICSALKEDCIKSDSLIKTFL